MYDDALTALFVFAKLVFAVAGSTGTVESVLLPFSSVCSRSRSFTVVYWCTTTLWLRFHSPHTQNYHSITTKLVQKRSRAVGDYSEEHGERFHQDMKDF